MFESTATAPPPPGVAGAVWLDAVDPTRLSPGGLVDVVAAAEQLIGWASAVQARALAELDAATDTGVEVGPEPGWEPYQRNDAKRSIATEVALVLRVSVAFAYDRLLDARLLVQRAPRAVDLLARGSMNPVQARDLAHALIRLIGVPDETDAIRLVLDRVLDRAVDDSTARFRERVRRAVMSAAPRSAEVAHAVAVADRKVSARAEDDGVGTLWARLPAPDLLRVDAAITDHANRYLTHNPDDPRTVDQRRADALVDLVELGATAAHSAGGSPSAKRAPRSKPVIQVTVALSTLLGDDDHPADLAGYGPIPASLARRIAADQTSTWRRLVTDPLGHLINYGRTRYKPPPDLADHIRARDHVCAFPTCPRRAIDCELDHLRAWNHGGETNESNLAPACSSHHHLKHDHGWQVTRDPETGHHHWTAPTGHTYTNQPPPLPTGTTPTATTPTPSAEERPPADDPPPF